MTPRNCLLATTHFPITTRRYNKREFLSQFSFYWEVSEISSFMRQQPLEMKKQGKGKYLQKIFFWGTKRKVSLLVYTCTSLPITDLFPLQGKILYFKENRLPRTIFSKNALPGLRGSSLILPVSTAHTWPAQHCLHKQQKMAVRRAFVSCWYPTAFKTGAKSVSELSACTARSATWWLPHRLALAGRHMCSSACLSASSSSL